MKALSAILFGVLALALSSCSQDPEVSKRMHVKQGDAFMLRQKYNEAIIEYRLAVQDDQNFGEARYKLGEAYAKTNDIKNAMLHYVRAADLMPENVDAQIKAGTLLLVARQFQDAKSRARTVLQRHPNDVRGLILLGNALAGLNDLTGAVELANKAAELDPQRPGTYRTLGALAQASGDNQQAEAAFKRALAMDSKSAAPHLALGTFYGSIGRTAEAQQSLERALAIDPSDLSVNQALAALYLGTKDVAKAEVYLKRICDLVKDVASQITLADFYIAQKRSRDADGVIAALRQTKDGFVPATLRLAAIQYSAKRVDEAYRLIDEALSRDPRHAPAHAMKARLFLAEGRTDDALNEVKAALESDPRSAEAQYMLGQIYLARNELEDARKAFAEVLALNPRSVPAGLELARLHRLRGELDTSIRYAERGLSTRPDSLDAQLALVRSLIVRPEDLPRAEAQLKKTLASYPNVAAVHALLGSYFVSRQNPTEARRAYENALKIEGSNVDALGALLILDMAEKRIGDARTRIDAALSKYPKNAELIRLAARTHAAAGDMKKAEALLLQAIETEPANLQSYGMLGQIYISQRRLEEAKTRFIEIAQRDPRSAAACTMVALLFQAQQNLDEAQLWYEKAVRIDPRAAAAANNLAWLYAEGRGSLDVALQLARGAKSEQPGDPDIGDTLAWIYYKKQMTPFALPLLEQSIEKNPSNPVYHYHLGAVYAQAGEDGKARRALQQALKLDPKFNGADDARKILGTLVY